MGDPVVSHTVATRWKRYGKDRLYVTASDGVQVGWWDLATDEPHPETPQVAGLLHEAVAVWRSTSPAGASRLAPGSRGERPTTKSDRPTARPSAAPEQQPQQIDAEWDDLAQHRPGCLVRAQAESLRPASPVRAFLARAFQVDTGERSWRVGADGEEKVGARLERLVSKDSRWHVLHSIPVGSRGSDIDHLVIGPAGVFTLNAKHHPGKTVWVRGDTLRVDGHRTSYIRNSRFEAERAARLLSAAAGAAVPVTGLIVPVRAKDVVVKRQPEDVFVVPRMHIVRWLQSRPAAMDDSTARLLFDIARRSTTWTQ